MMNTNNSSMYIVAMCSIHENSRMELSGPFSTYEAAEAYMRKDVQSAANGWEDADPDDIYVCDDDDGAASVMLNKGRWNDQEFKWEIFELGKEYRDA